MLYLRRKVDLFLREWLEKPESVPSELVPVEVNFSFILCFLIKRYLKDGAISAV